MYFKKYMFMSRNIIINVRKNLKKGKSKALYRSETYINEKKKDSYRFRHNIIGGYLE